MYLTGMLAGRPTLASADICGVGPFGSNTSANIGDQTGFGTVLIGGTSELNVGILSNSTWADPILCEFFKVENGAIYSTDRFNADTTQSWFAIFIMAGKVEINGVLRADGAHGNLAPKSGGGDGGAGSGGGGGGGGTATPTGPNGGNGGLVDGTAGVGGDAGLGGQGNVLLWFDANGFTNAVLPAAGAGGKGSDSQPTSGTAGTGAANANWASGGGGGGAGLHPFAFDPGSTGGGGGGGIIGIVCNEFTMGTNGEIQCRGGKGNGVDWILLEEPFQGEPGGGGGGGSVGIWAKKYDGSANGKILVDGGITNVINGDAAAGTDGSIAIFEVSNDCSTITARTLTDTWDNL